MTNTVLQLDNVEFRRNRRVIITDVNLTINAGERWVLFGPNGIGKSTAVGMLATRTFPSEGYGRDAIPSYSLHCLLCWCTSCSGKRQSRA